MIKFYAILFILVLNICCLSLDEKTTIPPQNENIAYRYTDKEIEYFKEVALGTEYGGNTELIRKWDSDIRIKINGAPNESDLAALNRTISDINDIIGNKISVCIDESNPNINIYFVPIKDFSICNAVPGNYGYFFCKWRNNIIYECDICIATDESLLQEERSHMIREELTQSLGLMKDSLKYPDSIFYERWSYTQKYSAIDVKMIEILYSKDIKAGMRKDEVEYVLRKQAYRNNSK